MRPEPFPPSFRQQVYAIVRQIPAGRVMTYGGIAALIPPPTSTDWEAYDRVKARWVGYSLAACPDDLPWQRVINARGGISPRPGAGPPLQRTLLVSEGVVFDERQRVDLAAYAWEPSAGWLTEHGLLARDPRDGATRNLAG